MNPLAQNTFDRLESVVIQHFLGNEALDVEASRGAAVDESCHKQPSKFLIGDQLRMFP